MKLACKVIFFEFDLEMLNSAETNVYSSIRLDLKDELIRRTTRHSYYLFSDLVLISPTTMAASTDRFISLFKVPEFDTMNTKTAVGWGE